MFGLLELGKVEVGLAAAVLTARTLATARATDARRDRHRPAAVRAAAVPGFGVGGHVAHWIVPPHSGGQFAASGGAPVARMQACSKSNSSRRITAKSSTVNDDEPSARIVNIAPTYIGPLIASFALLSSLMPCTRSMVEM